jgi:hypothetical protein
LGIKFDRLIKRLAKSLRRQKRLKSKNCQTANHNSNL